MADESKTQAGQTVLVVGASSGIGLGVVKALKAAGATVYATTRRDSPDLTATGATVIDGVDVANDDCGKVLLAGLGDAKLDAVIHNAGIFAMGALKDMVFADTQKMFNIDTIGPLRVIKALTNADAVKEGGKIVAISSTIGSLALQKAAAGTEGGMQVMAYGAAKAALNYSLIMVAAELKPKKIAVLSLCPGFVRTRLTSGMPDEMLDKGGAITPEESAAHILDKLAKLDLESSGSFWGTDTMPMLGLTSSARPW